MGTTSIRVELTSIDKPLDVLALSGTEAMSRLYRFDLIVALPADQPSVLGEAATIRLDSSGSPARTIAGWVTRVKQVAGHTDGLRRVHLRVTPHWSRLDRVRSSRIFQDKSTLEIVKEVLGEHDLELLFFTLEEPVKRAYCVQYQETSRAFLDRILAEEGWAYFFLDPEEGAVSQRVMITDDPTGYFPIQGDPKLLFRATDGAAISAREDSVTDLAAIGRAVPDQSLLRAYALRRPPTPLESSTPAGAWESAFQLWYEHEPLYGEDQIVLASQPVHEQVTRNASTFEGVTHCRRLAAGHTFELLGEDGSLRGSFAVVRARHTARMDPGAEQASWETRFQAVSAGRLYRPKRPARRVSQAIETATVVGPEPRFVLGEDGVIPRAEDPAHTIHTDELGRVKVQFHWDLRGRYDDTASCWLRVSQGWAGAGWGTQFVPRVGMEVIVGFIGGDPDRPIVLGCVDNAKHLPPFPLPRERTRSGFKTESIGVEGYNELSFDDLGGAEQIRIRAQKDMLVEVLNDESSSVGGDSRLTVEKNRYLDIRGGHFVQVQGPSSMTLAADATVIHEGKSTTHVRTDQQLDVGGSQTTAVRGNMSLQAGGSRTDSASVSHSLNAPSIFLNAAKDDLPGWIDLHSSGTIAAQAGDVMVVSATNGLRLLCGDSSIDLTPDTITLRAPHLVLLGGEEVTIAGKGPSLELSDTTELRSDDLRLLAKDGSLEIAGGKTSLKGKQIALESADRKKDTSDKDKDQASKTFEVILSDAGFKPYAGKRYEARALDKRIEGTTAADGRVKLEVPKDTRFVMLTLWPGKFPTGPTKQFRFTLTSVPSVDLVSGAQTRLKALGYYRGDTSGEIIDEPTRIALCAFQRDQKLRETGILDDETRRALVESYGE